jgi:anionic cell wall polymer biosynthesis LytR-Cps2A-Psr (LCP) family protein
LGQTVLLLATATVSASVGLLAALTVPLPSHLFPNDRGPESIEEILKYGFQYRLSRPVHILVMGIDRVPGADPGSAALFEGRSDTMPDGTIVGHILHIDRFGNLIATFVLVLTPFGNWLMP